MPQQLTEERVAVPASTGLLPAVRQAALVVLAFAAAGAVAGVVWEWVWTPPVGIAFDHEWLRDPAAIRGEFSSTAWYVVLALLAGLLAGVASALATRRRQLLTLAAVLAGSALAAWIMLQVGQALDPPDPRPLAKAAEDYTEIPAQLTVPGRSPFLAFPAGALVGLIVVFLGLSRHDRIDG
jgi:hypothetical protein